MPARSTPIWESGRKKITASTVSSTAALPGRGYLAGDYSIADVAAYPWIYRWDLQEIDLDSYPHVRDWLARIGDRPAVQRGLQIPPRDDGF